MEEQYSTIKTNEMSEANIQFLSQQFNQKIQLEPAPSQTQKIDQQNLNQSKNYPQPAPSIFVYPETLIVDDSYASQIKKFVSINYTLADLSYLASTFQLGTSIVQMHRGMIGVRKLLSKDQYQPPIQQIINLGLVTTIIQYATNYTEYPQLQLEAIWALGNIAAGNSDQCMYIVNNNGIDLFIKSLQNKFLRIVEECMCGLGNMAADSAYVRNLIIHSKGVQAVCKVVKQNMNIDSILGKGMWVLANLCRGKPLPKFQSIRKALVLIVNVLTDNLIKEQDVEMDCLWAVSYRSQLIMEINENQISQDSKYKLLKFAILRSNHKDVRIALPALSTIKGLISQSPILASEFYKNDGIQFLFKAFAEQPKPSKKLAYQVLNKFAQVGPYSMQGIFGQNLERLQTFKFYSVDSVSNKIQSYRVFTAIFQKPSSPQSLSDVFTLFKQNQIFSQMLTFFELNQTFSEEDLLLILNCISRILKKCQLIKGNLINPFVQQMYNNKVVQVLEKLQYHASEAVYIQVSQIILDFFEMNEGSMND